LNGPSRLVGRGQCLFGPKLGLHVVERGQQVGL
jgi:hypothetical protein